MVWGKMRKIFALIIIMCLASACAPMGPYKYADHVWEEKILNIPYQEAHRNLANGFRDCEIHSGWHIENYLYSDLKEGAFFIYSPGGFSGGRGVYKIGEIKLTAEGTLRTKMVSGVIRQWEFYPARTQNKRSADWFGMADGGKFRCSQEDFDKSF